LKLVKHSLQTGIHFYTYGLKRLAGVNFINFIFARFLRTSFRQLFSSYMYVTYAWKKLLERRSYEKRAPIKLMKLTADFFLSKVEHQMLNLMWKYFFEEIYKNKHFVTNFHWIGPQMSSGVMHHSTLRHFENVSAESPFDFNSIIFQVLKLYKILNYRIVL